MKILPLLALALATPVAPALAEPVAPVSQAVRTADLDLSSARDRTRLDHRIRIAVNSVCGAASQIDIVGQRKVKQCREETRGDVQAQINAALAAAARETQVASAK
jgi:UrcA family protein